MNSYPKPIRIKLGRREREEQRRRLWEQRGCRCQVCGRFVFLNEADRHHIIRRARGIDDTDENILIVCRRCHGDM